MNAYELFRTIGDDIQVAKCVLAIGRIQVDYVFQSSKVLGRPLDSACFLGGMSSMSIFQCPFSSSLSSFCDQLVCHLTLTVHSS
jgi:hypothetical protein